MTKERFDYQVTVAPDFASLLSNACQPVSDSAAATLIRSKGRSLIQARGGSGKTSYLGRLAALALENESDSVLLASFEWSRIFEPDSDRLADADALQKLLSPARHASRDLLVLLDGVNEVSSEIAARLIVAVDIVASREPRQTYLLADRLIRRDLGATDWALLGLTNVSEGFIRANMKVPLTESDVRSLSSPFYLDWAIAEARESRTGIHERFLLEHASVKADELKAIAKFAFNEYENQSDRQIDLERAETQLGADLLARLTSAGIIMASDNSYFAHHLIADYLAALHLSSESGKLTYSQLNALTFGASSFDALALLLELTTRNPDELVRDVYDWNMYGAGYLLAEDRAGAGRISRHMEFVIVAMLGDRMFDRFESTADQVRDALRVIATPFALDVLGQRDRAALVQLIEAEARDTVFPEWVSRWKHTFTSPEGAQIRADAREELLSDDAIVGWTASNSLRRASASTKDIDWASNELTSNDSSRVRWRAAHFLGAVPSAKSVDVLLNALDFDLEEWVRYGSLRSLIEIAASSDSALADEVFSDLRERAELLNSKPRLVRELERTLATALSPAGDWMSKTEELIVSLWATSESVDGQDRWAAVGRRIRERSSA